MLSLLRRPTIMFELPENSGCLNYLVKVSEYTVNMLKRDAEVTKKAVFCDKDVKNVCICVMTGNSSTRDGNIDNAIYLYTNLRNKVLDILQQI